MIEPLKDNFKKRLLQEIDKAEESIQIAVAWFTDDDLLNTLAHQAKKGRRVEVIISDHPSNFVESYSLDFELLKQAGGQLFVWEGDFFHTKFCVIDKKYVFSGSANYTYNGFYKNKEVTLLLKDPISVEWFCKEFEAYSKTFREEVGLVLSPLKYFYKREISFLKERIAGLETEIADAEKYIEQYEVQYRLRFFELISEILLLRKLLAEKKHKLIKKPESRKVVVETAQAWENFQTEVQEDKAKKEVFDDKKLQAKLKEVFHKAVKLCHPDNPAIPDYQKEQANKIFNKVKEAYDANKLEELENILEDLQSGLSFDNLNFEDTALDDLKQIYEKLKTKHDILFNELNTILNDPRYQLIRSDNLESHFKEQRIILEEELRVLIEKVNE